MSAAARGPNAPNWWTRLPWWIRVSALSTISFLIVWVPYSAIYMGFDPFFSFLVWALICIQFILVTWLGRKFLGRRRDAA